MNQETRQCQNCKQSFVIEPEDFEFYEKMKAPAPTWCPICRMRRRMSWRNERKPHKRLDNRTGKKIFSWFSDKAPVQVWEHDDWMKDDWDPLGFGMEIDWSRPFMEQVIELSRKVPWLSRVALYFTNSNYSMSAGNLKNCYLVLHADYCEDSLYSGHVANCKGCMDISYGTKSEQCYGSTFIESCYRTYFSVHCNNCVDVWFSKNCSSCDNCFGCSNLRGKKYHIFNKPYTKEQYEDELRKMQLNSFESLNKWREKASDFWSGFPVKFMSGFSNKDVTGDYIRNSKNCKFCFDIMGSENCKFCTLITPGNAKDMYDFNSYGESSELIYECSQIGLNSRKVKFSAVCWPAVSELEYCMLCGSSSNLFGCVGVRHKQYCILNKQYTKEEYEALVQKIKEHMDKMPYIDKKGRIYKYGEFFPADCSPFAYNDTNAHEYFPLTKEQALGEGLYWADPEDKTTKFDISHEDLPDKSEEIDESILNKIISCEHAAKCNDDCTYGFRLIPAELDFYKEHDLPLPHLCHNCRYAGRVINRTPIHLWARKCACMGIKSENGVYQNTSKHTHGDKPCPNEFETSYAPERQEIVYCEQCYNAEVV